MPKNLPEIPERCGYNECVPDITGYCVFCRHELIREVDDDGNPIEQDTDEEPGTGEG